MVTIDKETIYETFHLDRQKMDKMLDGVQRVVNEGNVRRILIKNAAGQTIVEFPLTVGVVGAALAPVWAAIGAVAAIATDCTITIEKRA
ncbi:MAG: DUF4342 domain-containing protein [Chloroflexota bacterium]|nr:DUF4342 domain-containing protein [Chloroflexota bacterium]